MILDIQDIIISASIPALIKDEFIKRGNFFRLRNGDLQACVGGFSIVFPVEVNGTKWAFRCWHHTLDNDQERIKLLSAELKKSGLPYFIDFEYEDKGIVVNGVVYPTTRMKWINGYNIKDYICKNKNNRHNLFELASKFFAMTQELHKQSIAHGDLQHENIIVNTCGNIYLIDYDSMYTPGLSYLNSKNSTNGKEGYQHPARENCVYSNPKLDYFSEVIILTSILAIAHKPNLIEKYKMEDSDTMLFKKADFQSFSSSCIYSDLSSMGDIFIVLINVITNYLKKQDITDLDPLELAINKANPTNAISIADYLKNAKNILLDAEKKAEEQREERLWRTYCQQGTAHAFTLYLTSFPNGRHTNEAKERIEELKREEAAKEKAMWDNCCFVNMSSAYSKYIKEYPSGVYISEAQEKYNECKDKEDWSRTISTNTIYFYKWYLITHPNGNFVGNAKVNIRRLEDEEKRRQKEEIKQEQERKKLAEQAKIKARKRARLGHIKDILLHSIIPACIIISIGVYAIHMVYTYKPNSNTNTYIQQPQKLEMNDYARSLECDIDKQLKSLEAAKQYNSGLDYNMKQKVGNKLKELSKYNSNKYKGYKERYDKL